MRPPLEYGDNFPVPSGSWDPAVPWRFPKHSVRLRQASLWTGILPWVTLGVGISLGVLWMSWRMAAPLNQGAQEAVAPTAQPVQEQTEALSPKVPLSEPAQSPPRFHPIKVRSQLA